MVSEPSRSNEQGSAMSNPNTASSSTNTPSPSSNLSLLISNLNAFVSVKLDASNFLIWKNQWENILKATGLLSFVDGTGVAPPPRVRNSSNEEITNSAFLQWMVDDAHLMSCLSGTLSPQIYPVILNCHSSLEAWTNIEKRFTTLSRSHVHQLKNRLNSTAKNANTMEFYLQQIKTLTDQLALAGSPVDNEDLVLITLNGLSDEFRAFKTSIRTRPSPITMEELCSLLLSEAIHEESSLKPKSLTDLTVAFTASRGGFPHQGNRPYSPTYFQNSRGSRGSYRNSYRGGRYNSYRGGYRGGGGYNSYRGRFNHTSGSPSGVGSPSQNYSSGGGVQCQICDKPGHTAFDCWHRLNPDFQPQPSLSGSSSPHLTSIPSQNKAFVASVPEQSTSNWYVDSAASTHITNDLSNLSLYETYHGPEQVTVGNGSTLPIQNTGNGQGAPAGAFSGPAY